MTSISATKANGYFTSEVIQGPGYTGGDLIQGSGSMGSIPITPPRNAYNKKYHLRVRYAADFNGLLTMTFTSSSGPGTVKINFNATMKKGDSFKYNSFQYVEKEVYISSIDNGINLSAGSGFYLDKVEFIPVNEN